MEKSKEEIMKKAFGLGFKYERDFTVCCQCTIAAIQDALGMRNDDLFKASTGLSGGIALSGIGACGGLVAGVMMISSKFGRERENFADKDSEAVVKINELSQKLYDKFIEEYGSITCSGVQEKIFGKSFNLKDPDELEEFHKAGAHVDKCPSVVGNAAKWAVEILLE